LVIVVFLHSNFRKTPRIVRVNHFRMIADQKMADAPLGGLPDAARLADASL